MISTPGVGWTPAHVEIATTTGKKLRSGWTKGSFGIVEFNIETRRNGWIDGASLTHLGTGWRIAAFDDATSAAIAGDLAEQCANWSTLLDPTLVKSQVGDAAKARMVSLWSKAGLYPYFAADTYEPTMVEIIEQIEARHEGSH